MCSNIQMESPRAERLGLLADDSSDVTHAAFVL